MLRKALLLVLTCLVSTICVQAQKDTLVDSPPVSLGNLLERINKGAEPSGGVGSPDQPIFDTTYVHLNETISYKAGSRLITSKDLKLGAYSEGGFVVLTVVIKSMGTTESAKVDLQRTRTTDIRLWDLAKEFAKNSTFSADEGAPPRQKIEMVFRF